MDITTLALTEQPTDKQRIAYEYRKESVMYSAEPKEVQFVPNDTLAGFATWSSGYHRIERMKSLINPIAIVTWNDRTYRCSVVTYDDGFAFGNFYIADSTAQDTGEPFYCMASSSLYDGEEIWITTYPQNVTIFALIEYDAIKTIDEKFIPVMSKLTLLGADGKQYKVTVNESGVLIATEVG